MALDELLATSDFVSLHAPLNDQSRHLIDAAALARMKPTAVLVNTARGALVDEAALVEALRSGAIAAAGLDVFEDEPRLAPGLAELDNVVVLPHIGSATTATRGGHGRAGLRQHRGRAVRRPAADAAQSGGAAMSDTTGPATAEQRGVLARLGAATLGESGGRAMRARIRPMWPGAHVVGEAVPVRCAPGDNLAIHVATATASPRPGAGGARSRAIRSWATGARCSPPRRRPAASPGWSSMVACGTWPRWPVEPSPCSPPCSRCAARRRWRKAASASRWRWATSLVEAGDVIVGDGDGVTVVPGGSLAEVLAAGQAREAKEASMFTQLEAGATTIDLLGLDPSPIRQVD